MTFNEKLINLRKMRGLSQTDLALAIGVSRQAVYKWESGQSYPEAAKLIELKVFFNISIDDMLDDSFDVVLPAKKKRKRLSRDVKREIELGVINEEPTPAPVYAAASEGKMPEENEPALPEENVTEENQETAVPEKKKGFFGRIFGRK